MDMKSFLTFSKFALSRLLSASVGGFPASAAVNSVSSSQDGLSWHDDYLIGKSDIDAAWYYERRRWRS
jgi:hypothetical protein